MSNGTVLKSKDQVSETQVNWDEFRKIVKVGDTYLADGLSKKVTEKTFELDSSYEYFTIKITVQ